MQRFSLTLAFVVVAPLVMSAQWAMGGGSSHQRGVHEQGVALAGKVSNDGKTLLADDDNRWNVSNMDILKGFEGRYVTVKCRMDPTKQAIRVLYIILEPTAKHAENWSDSAFRR